MENSQPKHIVKNEKAYSQENSEGKAKEGLLKRLQAPDSWIPSSILAEPKNRDGVTPAKTVAGLD